MVADLHWVPRVDEASMCNYANDVKSENAHENTKLCLPHQSDGAASDTLDNVVELAVRKKAAKLLLEGLPFVRIQGSPAAKPPDLIDILRKIAVAFWADENAVLIKDDGDAGSCAQLA